MFGAIEVDKRSFGAACYGSGHIGVSSGKRAGGAGEGPAFEFERAIVFQVGDLFIKPGDLGRRDGVRMGIGVALFEAGRGGDLTHEVNEPALHLGADFDGLRAVRMNPKETEGGVEFVDIPEGMDSGVFFGDPVAKEEIGFSLVTAACSDRHSDRYAGLERKAQKTPDFSGPAFQENFRMSLCCAGSAFHRADGGALLDGDRVLALTAAEVVEASAADFAEANDLDFGNLWGVKRENTFDAFAVGDLADGVSGVEAGTFAGNDETGVDLNPLLVTFDNAAMDFDGISHTELRNVRFELLLFEFGNDVHSVLSGYQSPEG